MDRIQSMQVFVRVAELSSFTKAAESLGMPKASVSAYVQDLESQVKTRLFHRTTRTVQLTQDGISFYERCKDLLSDIEETESMFQTNSSAISGRVRIDMPTRIAKRTIIPNLPQFLEKYPKIEIELSSTDRRVDVIQEGFDCVVRVGTLADSELIARPVGEYKIINCVGPSYIEKFGRPKNLADLKDHYLVHYVGVLGSKSDGFEYLEDGKYKFVKMKGFITVNNTEAYLSACLNGLGIVQIPEAGVKDLLDSGKLVQVLKKLEAEPMPISIIYPNRRNLSRRVQIVMDWMAEKIKYSF